MKVLNRSVICIDGDVKASDLRGEFEGDLVINGNLNLNADLNLRCNLNVCNVLNMSTFGLYSLEVDGLITCGGVIDVNQLRAQDINAAEIDAIEVYSAGDLITAKLSNAEKVAALGYVHINRLEHVGLIEVRKLDPP